MTTIDISSAWYEILWMFKYVFNNIWIVFDGADDGITMYDLFTAGFVLVSVITAFTMIWRANRGEDVEGD